MKETLHFSIVPINNTLRGAVQPLFNQAWAGPFLALNGSLHDSRTLPGIAAINETGAILGYLLYEARETECEIMALESLCPGSGVGTALIERVKTIAREQAIQKIVVTTTNDNIHAIRFYQKRGFTLRALRVNMLDISRRLKPGIPLIGNDGIPLRDEIELEIKP
jgi:GNAT superfamily N-acetyltransferase